ncbi:aldehyde dehydrogenase [Paraburkholderia sp. Ac-20336]|uniref:aldehyde dehydrogenase n=1 Tax=unclassified Paraburkholderia TaxID=2615204 RepID=UPI00141EAF44|nr:MULTISPECIES: aldehyde dehydrogenase [unclassified Paraburkholderia]MBN3801711.1 aldehyde dehydrogenase [Paraburkholderia sp. Ac-20336]MBN3845635.1 aldehyde dehydrogenase [Paraburkholderia sp. Ac-20342]NIF75910.1 aldehyde dehydrogenase [Paraburkholderia sp. Cy-641]
MVSISVESLTGTRTRNWIDGAWHEPASGTYLDSFNPFTGEAWYQIADSNADDVGQAVQAAERALHDPAWRGITQTDRANLLRKLAELIRANVDRLARLEVHDNGKLLKEMRAQIGILPDQFHYFAGAADKLEGTTIPVNRRDVLAYTSREPIGVVGVIVPWNSPLYQLSWTLAPALACGNTVVVKPSEHTSASALALAELIKEAGIPDGVFNVVTGLGASAGEALTRDARVAKVAFTGSTASGRKVAHAAADHFAQCNLELGGKSPNCVFDDAPFERALDGVVAGIFAAGGQTCVAGSRIYVQRTIFNAFRDALIERARAVKLGDPLMDDTQMGPVAVKSQLEKIGSMVSHATQQGARLLAGGKRAAAPLDQGWFYEPTLLDQVAPSMEIVQEEVFGPVGVIQPFEDERDLARLANATRYGLTAGVWTRDIDRAMRFARDVEAGTIWVNTYRAASFTTPMGGFKESGYGKHYGLESMREYSRAKSVVVDYSGNTPNPFVMRVSG